MLNKDYKILNYSTSDICVPLTTGSLKIAGANGEVPGIEFVSAQDLQYINSRTNVFKTGAIEFEESVQEECYTFLKLHNWQDTVIHEHDIQPMLLNPTVEVLEAILKIRDIATFERIRGCAIGLVNSGYDVSSRVIKMLESRFTELNKNPRAETKIVVRPKEVSTKTTTAEMENEIAELKNMLQKMMEEKTKTESDEAEEKQDIKPAVKSTRGRKPANT